MSKKQKWVLICFLLLITFFYSLRPLTQKYGDKSIGFVTNMGGSALKGGKMKIINYAVNNKIYETSSGQYFHFGDQVEVSYFESLLWFKDGIVGEKIYNNNTFLIYSKNVRKGVKQVRIFSNNKFVTSINIKEDRNFGYYLKNASIIKLEMIYENRNEVLLFSVPYNGNMFREIK